ncbi:MAG: transcriptional regulator, partial [Solobacterium sp.]|nr:transcriptional regulator [Solobacterium sp.]
DGKQVVRVSVSVGTERPYYLAKEGLKPKGVFVRRGSACMPLSEAGIREMIMETSGKSYEESRSLNQDLTFDSLKQEMQKRNLSFGKPQMKTLKITGSDGLYTNLGLILSDQCPFTIKTAVFQGRDSSVFRERKEFSGSVLKQLNDVYQFLDLLNKTKAGFSGLIRTDQRDYPEYAVREALLNSIIHRDYLFSGSTIINLYDDHMEFISLGGLVRGISMEAVFMGISQSRNPSLAAVFYRLGLVESYGTGVRKIMDLYQNSVRKPEFRSAEGAFTAVLPNRNEPMKYQTHPSRISGVREPSVREKADALIMRIAKENGQITRKEIEKALSCGSTKAFKILKRLCENGMLVQQKNGNLTVYIPN